jgi:hypothetical protein
MSRIAVVRSTLGFLAVLALELALGPAPGGGRAAQAAVPIRR